MTQLLTSSLSTIHEVVLAKDQLAHMLEFARLMFTLKQHPAYVNYVQQHVPDSAMLGHDDASILMGFDFHLDPEGPKLIEINNNAGGLYAGRDGWLAQPSLSSEQWPSSLTTMFPAHWRHIAIMDESIQEQFMLPEMQAYAELLSAQGRHVVLCSPEDLSLHSDGLYADHLRIDGIYNRHTDFYLQQAEMQHIRQAVMQGNVDINPFPRSYALLGDKERMVDWCQDGLLEQWLSVEDCEKIRRCIPETHRLTAFNNPQQLWEQRKQWVFKPPRSHAGKGVLLGKGTSRKRFDTLDPQNTLVQRYIPAEKLTAPDGSVFRVDYRLYLFGGQLMALAARVWQGQVTNFRQQGSGWAAVRVTE